MPHESKDASFNATPLKAKHAAEKAKYLTSTVQHIESATAARDLRTSVTLGPTIGRGGAADLNGRTAIRRE